MPASAARAITPSEVAGTPFGLAVHDRLDAVEQAWRSLEREAVLTPYQRYDWVKALLEARPLARGRLAIAVARDAAGAAVLLPFHVERRAGLRVAEVIGSDIANADWLPVRRGVAPLLGRQVLKALLGEAGRQAGGIDAVVFRNLPARWQGLDNPLLAFPHQPAPDHLYLGGITPEGVSEQLSHKRFRNIARGKRRLAEAFGGLELREARTEAEIARVHAAFLEQRAARFAQMGVHNIFAEDWFVAFFRRAAGRPADDPVLRFHALYGGEHILATAVGAYAGSHYSQYINSTCSGPAAKYSLISILMHSLVSELAATGITSIDMGLGDFAYKSAWGTEQVVYDAAIGLTAAGTLAGRAIMAKRAIKRRIKQDPRLFGLLKRLRAGAARPGGAGTQEQEADR